MTQKFRRTFLFISILFSITALGANAQQTVFNVPTVDIMDRGKVYAELDASFKPNNQASIGRFSSFVPRVVVGAGRNVEVGLNLTGNIQPGSDSTTIVPTVKWRFYQSLDKKTAVIVGANLFVPVRNRTFRFGTYTYAAAARSFKKTRVTAGGFLFSRSVAASNAVRGGGQFAVEQTITDKFSIAADWLTGKHSNGYFTPGAVFKPRPNVTVYAAYSIGNGGAKAGNQFLLVEFGYNF